MSETGVPALRFPEFEGEWEKKRMDTIAKVSRGKFSVRPRNDPRYFGGSIPFVQTGDVVNADREVLKFSQTLNDLGVSVSKVFPAETILMSIAANIGDVAITAFPTACPDSVVGIVCNANTSVGFLFESLGTKKSELMSYATQNAQANINLEILNPLKISIPTLPEQQKIADFFGAVDARVALLRRRRDALRSYKKGMMQRLFSQQLRFTKPDGSPFPDWQEKRLGEVFFERSERSVGDAELLSVTTRHGIKRLRDLDRTDNSSEDKSNYKSVYVGDIAYNSMRMWQGASGLSPYDGIVSPAYTVITCQHGNVPKFWAHYFKLTSLVHLFQRSSQGLTSDTWNLKFPALARIKVMMPTHPEEQQKIAYTLTALDTKIDAVTAQMNAMMRFKKGLLQQMFV